MDKRIIAGALGVALVGTGAHAQSPDWIYARQSQSANISEQGGGLGGRQGSVPRKFSNFRGYRSLAAAQPTSLLRYVWLIAIGVRKSSLAIARARPCPPKLPPGPVGLCVYPCRLTSSFGKRFGLRIVNSISE